MQEYKKYITDLAATKSNTVFYNSGPSHAAHVIENIFLHTKKKVRIYSGCLKGDISGQDNYRNAFIELWSRNAKIEILLQTHKLNKLKSEKKEPPIFVMFRLLKKVRPESIDIREVESRVIDGDNEIHFLTGDDCMYRLENNTDTFSATGNFNDPETVSKLNSLFDGMFLSAKPLAL